MGDTLTLEKLMDQVKALGEPLPRMRIIVGFPLVASGEIAQHIATNTFLIGENAWREVERQCAPSPLALPGIPPSTFLGVEVERYDPERQSHRDLVLTILREFRRSPSAPTPQGAVPAIDELIAPGGDE